MFNPHNTTSSHSADEKIEAKKLNARDEAKPKLLFPMFYDRVPTQRP